MLTAERLRELFSYNPDTGEFVRLVRTSARGPLGPVRGSLNSAGYPRVFIDGRSYLMHRLAFLYMTGRWPAEELDHRDGDPSNYRWANLREATRAQNCQNMRRSKKNKSGLKGASFNRQHGTWVGSIAADGTQIMLGRFDTAEAAHAAYCEAARRLHGEFARVA